MRSIAALAVLCALLVACGGSPQGTARAEVGATDRCGTVELPPVQAGSHLLGDADPPVPYSSTPPTSGWHASGAPPLGVFDTPLSEPGQVLALEVGAVVITHRGLEDHQIAELRALATAPPLAGRVTVTPYERIAPGEVVLATWGALQRCDGVDEEAIRRFVAAFAVEDPTAHG